MVKASSSKHTLPAPAEKAVMPTQPTRTGTGIASRATRHTQEAQEEWVGMVRDFKRWS